MPDATPEYKPNAELLSAGVLYLHAQEDLQRARQRMENVLYDFVREHFPIVDSPWHKTSYHAVWEAGQMIAVDVVQRYSDEHGSSQQTFRVNLGWEF